MPPFIKSSSVKPDPLKPLPISLPPGCGFDIRADVGRRDKLPIIRAFRREKKLIGPVTLGLGRTSIRLPCPKDRERSRWVCHREQFAVGCAANSPGFPTGRREGLACIRPETAVAGRAIAGRVERKERIIIVDEIEVRAD